MTLNVAIKRPLTRTLSGFFFAKDPFLNLLRLRASSRADHDGDHPTPQSDRRLMLCVPTSQQQRDGSRTSAEDGRLELCRGLETSILKSGCIKEEQWTLVAWKSQISIGR